MTGRILGTVVVIMCTASMAIHGDVRSEEKSLVKFEGAMGRVVNFFGGKAAKDGIVSTVTVKGPRKVTMNDSTGQIVDLQEEKVYDLDLRTKTYTVTTFAEIRKQMAEAREKAAEQAAEEAPEPEEKPEPADKRQVEIDFDLKESGQTRTINGFDTREVIMTVVAREKGKTLEQSGGMVMTTNSWLAPKIAGLSEVADFDRRYAEKLHGPMLLDAQQMAAMTAMYPMLQDAIARLQKENVNLDGTAVLTVLKVEAVKNPEQAGAAKESSSPAAGLGGLGGRLARRMMKKSKDEGDASAQARATVMTMQHEVLKVTPSVADGDVALPAGFTMKKLN
jgi:hypothetical protein